MRSFTILFIFTLFVVSMDIYAFRGIHQLLGSSPKASAPFTWVYFGITLIMLIILIWAGSRFQHSREPTLFFGVMVIMGIFLMLYVPKLIFNVTQLMGDLTHMVVKVLNGNTGSIRKWFLLPGAVLGLFLVFAFGLGILRGRTNIKVYRENVQVSGLPTAFAGLKIVQLSDIHLAGFYNHPSHIRKVVEQVNKLDPDLILFTGDMVHNFSEELDPFVGILEGLQAPLGKFAVLGNHDYGHYYQWETEQAEQANLDRVKEQIRLAGFDLLLNEHRTIPLNGSAIEIIGVENWGKPPFPQHGDLAKALDGTVSVNTKILLSHDPSHWDLMVRGREKIALTLSGHTHAMQFGIEIGNFRWSPSQWTYKHWAGLYHENGQSLYVNRGLGYTGFPGRVGIRPEITLLTLEGSRTQLH